MMVGEHAVHAQELKKAQPVAYRVLKQIEVRCPLRAKHKCPWTGDYGDLQDHLLSTTAHSATNTNTARSTTHSTTTTTSTSRTASTSYKKARHVTNLVETVQVGEDGHEQDDNDEEETRDEDSDAMQVEESDRKLLAASFKEQANGMFASANYKEASDLYAKGISLLAPPLSSKDTTNTVLTVDEQKLLAALHTNRAAALLKIREWQTCVDECSKALAIDPHYTKAHMRRTKALLELGRFEEAYSFLQQTKGSPSSSNGRSRNQQLSKLLRETKTIHDDMLKAETFLSEDRFAAAKSLLGTLLRETSLVGSRQGRHGSRLDRRGPRNESPDIATESPGCGGLPRPWSLSGPDG